MSARSTGSTAGFFSHVRISSGSISASVAARSITSGSSSASPVKVSTRSRRRKAGSRSGACRRVATTARHAGSDAPSSTGRQSIGIPYSSCSRRRLFDTFSGGNSSPGRSSASTTMCSSHSICAPYSHRSRSRCRSAENANGQPGSV